MDKEEMKKECHTVAKNTLLSVVLVLGSREVFESTRDNNEFFILFFKIARNIYLFRLPKKKKRIFI
jgi:hypothetical protein